MSEPTLPDSGQLAPSVPALVRLYVEAVLREQLDPILAEINRLAGVAEQVRQGVDAKIDTYVAKVNLVERLIPLTGEPARKLDRILQEAGRNPT